MREMVDGAVGAYIESLSLAEDKLLTEVRRLAKADGVPALDRLTARFLHVLASAMRVRRVLEIGTGYGYSGIHLARAMPDDGLLFTFELNPERAAVARQHFAQAGLTDRVNVLVGDAARLLHKVAGPFDLVLQDGDKLGYQPMLDRIVALLRPGGVLITDNVLWSGDVVPDFSPGTPQHDPVTIDAIAGYNRRLAADPRLITTVIPVGDGVGLSFKRDGATGEQALT
jgi:predicted O-methyltransferase YrrM